MTNYKSTMSQKGLLYHHGVKGQKWGVRRYVDYDGTLIKKSEVRNQTKMAKKDAKETAKAKMYYGEGAGVRRRHIKATVDQRSKNPVYKKEYEKALAQTDMNKARKSAATERRVQNVKNTVNKVKRTASYAVGGSSSVVAAAAVFLITHPNARKKVVETLYTAMNEIEKTINHSESQQESQYF